MLMEAVLYIVPDMYVFHVICLMFLPLAKPFDQYLFARTLAEKNIDDLYLHDYTLRLMLYFVFPADL